MPICPQCGTRNPPENTTCRSCGALLEVPPAPAPPAAPEEAAPPPPAPEKFPLGRAVVFGLAAAVVLGGIWFVAEYLTHQPLPFLAPLIGWGVAEAVVWGAGRRRSRELQWLALGLTLLAVVGTLLALAATDPAGFSDGLQLRLQDIFSLLLYLLSLFVAYASPAPRPAPRPQPQEPEAGPKEGEEEEKPAEEGEETAEAEPALRCVRCQSPTTEEEALMLPARRGQMAALCPRCVAEIEARFAAESEDIQIGPAVLYGLGAALAGGVLWYLAERFSGMGLAFLAFIFGWLIAEAVRLGAGRKRGRVLQWISLGLTLAMIVGTQVALAATVLPAQDGRPSWSPGGTHLAFQSDRSGNWEIYVLQVDGDGGARLTNNANADMSPAWSPEGKYLAFQSDRGGGWGLYTMNAADGTEVTRLAIALPDGEEPAWSPDGSRLALVSRSDGNAEIYVVNADGSGLLRLTENAADDEHPSWSPDGTRLAFASERDGNWEIYTMNADGTGVARLTDHPAADRSPAWSPDGESIAFVSERDGNAEIYRMDAGGNHLRRLTQEPAEDGDPAWSPEGKLAFRSERDGDAEIYRMDADGGQVVPLTRDPAGTMEVLLARLQDPFTLLLFLLGLFQAYSTPAPRRLPRRKQEGSPGR